MIDHEFKLSFYQQFHNYLAVHGSDKIIKADLFADGDHPILNVNVTRRNFSLANWPIMFSGSSSLDMLELIRNKEETLWSPIDYECARAIMCAIKCFERLHTDAQLNGFFDTYLLGYIIPSNTKTLNTSLSEAKEALVSTKKSVANIHETSSREHKNYADSKNCKYPIDTPEHVRSAISCFAIPKNHDTYSVIERETIAKSILTAAEKHDIEVSDGWKDKFFKKSLQNLRDIVKSLAAEGMSKEDISNMVLETINKRSQSESFIKDVFGKSVEIQNTEWDVLETKVVKSLDKRDTSRDVLNIRLGLL